MINKLIEKYNNKLKCITDIKNKTSFELVAVSCSEKEFLVKNIIQDLEELKKTQLQNLNEVKAYLGSQKVTPEMVAIAMRKIEISILGVDTDE